MSYELAGRSADDPCEHPPFGDSILSNNLKNCLEEDGQGNKVCKEFVEWHNCKSGVAKKVISHPDPEDPDQPEALKLGGCMFNKLAVYDCSSDGKIFQS